MRWVRAFCLIFCVLPFWHTAACADDARVIASATARLRSPALGKDERIKFLFERGLAYDRKGELDEAIADYGAILDIAPNSWGALNNRANAYRRQGRLLDAKRDYLASLVAGNPRPAYSEFGLGQIAEAEGDQLGAREHYRRALASDPGYRLASERLAALGPDEAFSTVQLIPPRGGSDPDRIVLKPPAPRSLVLKKPQPVQPQAQNRPPQNRYGWTQVAEAKSPKASDVTLRPAIPEGARPPSKSRPQAKAQPKPNGKVKVQLGAWRTRAEAEAGLARARRLGGQALAGVGTEIVEAHIPGKGRYFRLRAGAASRAEAERLCAELKARGLDCIRAPN